MLHHEFGLQMSHPNINIFPEHEFAISFLILPNATLIQLLQTFFGPVHRYSLYHVTNIKCVHVWQHQFLKVHYLEVKKAKGLPRNSSQKMRNSTKNLQLDLRKTFIMIRIRDMVSAEVDWEI